jgi:hypothetical protein
VVARKIGSFVFFTKNSIFDPKNLKKPLETLLNQSMAMKNVKNRPKTRNPPKTKKIPWLNYDFLGIFKVK